MEVRPIDEAVNELEKQAINNKIDELENLSPFIQDFNFEEMSSNSNHDKSQITDHSFQGILAETISLLDAVPWKNKDSITSGIDKLKIESLVDGLESIIYEIQILSLSQKKLSVIKSLVKHKIEIIEFPNQSLDDEIYFRILSLKLKIIDIIIRLASVHFEISPWEALLFQTFNNFRISQLLFILKKFIGKLEETIDE